MGNFAQNEIMFPSAGGPMISGSWYNPKTGDSFTVRDSFMEDNNFIIVTMDGRRLDSRIMQDYIQSDEKTINEIKKHKKEERNQPKQPLKQQKNPKTIIGDLGEYSDELPDMVNEEFSTNPYYEPEPEPKPGKRTQKPEVSEESINQGIIKKAVAGLPKPTINISINFDGDIKQPVQFLETLMGIKKEDIAKEICDMYMDNMMEQIRTQIGESI